MDTSTVPERWTGGVDCWRGSLESLHVTGLIVTVDMGKQDSELKWLIGCTHNEMEVAMGMHRTENQASMLILRAGY